MYRPNDSTNGQQQPLEAGNEWKLFVAQEAWAPDYNLNRGHRQGSRDNTAMEDELNFGLNFNIFEQQNNRPQSNESFRNPQNRALNELHSGEKYLNKANGDLNQAIRALSDGDSEQARRSLIKTLHELNGGVRDLRDGMRLNPDDSRGDRRGERNVRGGIEDLTDSRNDLRKALRLLNEGNEEEAMKLLRKGRKELKNGREEVDNGVDQIERANGRGGRGGCAERPEPKPPCGEPKEPPTEKPPCGNPKEPPVDKPPFDKPIQPPFELPEPPCDRKNPPGDTPLPPFHPPVDTQPPTTEPPCDTPQPPTCEPPIKPPCDTPKEPPTIPPCEPKEPPFYDVAERHLIWGDPHIQDAKGNNIEDQIEANRNVLLVETIDGASITGHTTSFDNPELRAQEGHDITVFDKEVVSLGDGTRILFQSDGTAYRVDANGTIGEPLKDNEVVTSSKDANDKVTYDAETRTLSFSFVGDDKSTISGVLTGNIDPRGNYLNTEVKESGGMFGGFMPALRADFTGITVDSKTGAGAFDNDRTGRQRTNEDFFVDGLYNQ